MSDNARTTRWPLVVNLVASLLLTGLFPLTTAAAVGGARVVEKTQAPKGCCGAATARACCGMGCCAAPAPRPAKPALPGTPTDDRRGGGSCPLAPVAADTATDHDKAAADWPHDPSSLTGAGSTLQSTHVRLNA